VNKETEEITISEKAINDLLGEVEAVAANNGIGRGKEGMLILLGLAAGQISAEMEIEDGQATAETVDHLMNAVRTGIYKSHKSGRSLVPVGANIH
jgi:hypothetical protein